MFGNMTSIEFAVTCNWSTYQNVYSKQNATKFKCLLWNLPDAYLNFSISVGSRKEFNIYNIFFIYLSFDGTMTNWLL